MNDPELDEPAPQNRRPLWQWIALAIAPGLLCDAVAVFAKAMKSDFLAFCLLLMPLAILIHLIVLSGQFYGARQPRRAGSRILFVVGFGIVNAFLWGSSCAIVLNGMSFH